MTCRFRLFYSTNNLSTSRRVWRSVRFMLNKSIEPPRSSSADSSWTLLVSVSSAGLVHYRANRLRLNTSIFRAATSLSRLDVRAFPRIFRRSIAANLGRDESVFQNFFNFTFLTKLVRVDFGTVLDPSRFPRFPGFLRFTYSVLRFIPRQSRTGQKNVYCDVLSVFRIISVGLIQHALHCTGDHRPKWISKLIKTSKR